MIKQYIIIYERSYDKLENRVSEAMDRGYIPHGNLVFRPEFIFKGTRTYVVKEAAFIQPMVLKD